MISWLTYIRIKHTAVKLNALLLPLLLAVGSTLLFALTPQPIAVWGKDGLANLILVVSGLFPGFFLAALTAAATFSSTSIDEEISDKDTKYPFIIGKKTVWDVPSKRQIAVFLFHFLLVISIIIVLLSSISTFLVTEEAMNLYWNEFKNNIDLAFVFLILFLGWQLIIVLLQGVDFFVGRLMSKH